MTALVLAEHDNAALNEATAKAVTAALAISGSAHVLVAGSGCGAAAQQAAKLQGVATVLVADDPRYANMLPEPTAELILSKASAYDAIVAPATANGKNILPRVAARLDVPQISEVISVQSPDVFRRPIYAGNAVETVEAKGFQKVVTVRVSAFAATPAGGNAKIETISPADDPKLSRFLDENLTRSERPELTGAKIVISGGRGLQSKENFVLIERIADRLGAAVGA